MFGFMFVLLFYSVLLLSISVAPLLVIIYMTRYSFRHWKKATWYFKLGACFSLAAFGISFLAYLFSTTEKLSRDPLAGLGYLFLLILPTVVAVVMWCIVWTLGFLIVFFGLKKVSKK